MFSSSYAWRKVLNILADHLDDTIVATWFDDVEVVSLTESQLILYSPSEFRREIIQNKYMMYIKDALKELFDHSVDVLLADDKQMQRLKNSAGAAGIINTFDLNVQYTFDNFVVGSSNQFAHSAAVAVTNEPGQTYNPLFIYGPPGVGKTHLLYAIANGIRAAKPDANIVYIKGDQFTNELITAIRSGKNVEFRSKYREADLFLVDDIQFIAGKESTQEEFFHTFNKLYEEKKQIVLTSDRKPGEIQTLEERLRSRFEWGLIASIDTPDYETRMAIIKNKASSLGLELDDEICNYIAVNLTNNIRQIEGTVKKIVAHRDLNDMPLDLSHVTRVIGDMFKTAGGTLPSVNLIISQVCKFYSIDESTLRGTLRNKATVEARQVAIYLIRKLTNLSTTEIGAEFGKDHTTIMHSNKKVEMALAGGDTALQNHIRDITANINENL